jgi:DNA-directed RNA polymerase subunit RPC12/RpoP
MGHHGGSAEGTEAVACPSCGSWAVKADRSLAGRMVCARCGQPLGRRGMAGGRPRRRPRRWHGWLGLGLVLGVSALLASLPPRGREAPPSRLPTSPGANLRIERRTPVLVAIR